MNFNEQKATAVASFFLAKAGGQDYYLKLMKLMYLAEREAIRRMNRSITGDRFVSMDNGPVLSNTLNRLIPQDEIDLAKVWREHISLPQDFKVHLKTAYPAAKSLSKGEVDILEGVWNEFGSWDRWELVRHTHDLPEWKDPSGSSLPIQFQDILAALDLPPEQVKSRFAEHKAMEQFDSLIEAARYE